MHELNTAGLNCTLKYSATSKFETLNPTISVNGLVFENNEVFPLYASKHRDRTYHVNLLLISNSEGKFHYLIVRDLFALVYGRTNHQHHLSVCPYCLYCFSHAHLLTVHLADCSVHPAQKMEYPSPDDPEKNIKKFKSIAKTLSVPFVLYADFEAFLVPAEENKENACNTKVRKLHKPSGFACLRVSQVPEFNGEIFTYSGEDSMTVFFEHLRDQNHYVRSILSDVKPMKTLTAEQQLIHAVATTCELCHGSFTKKNEKTNITVVLADFT